MNDFVKSLITIVVAIALIVGGFVGLIRGYQTFKVYAAEQSGKAEYARAESNRRIAVLEAQALKDSATLKAEAEVERAKGVAQANAIIADGLKGNEDYLRYLWIQGLENNNQAVIYVPTEAGLPILEAGKR